MANHRGALSGRGGVKVASGFLMVALPVAMVMTMIVWPICLAVIDTLWTPGPDGPTFSFAAYRFFFTDGYSLGNLWITIWTSAVSMAILMIVSIPLSLYLRFHQGPAAAVVQALAIFPLFVPSVILAYAFVRVLGPNGMVDLILINLGLPKIVSPYLTPWGPVIGFVWDNLPLSVVILLAGLSGISKESVEAARDVGAGPLQVLRHIILPRIGPSILVAASFVVLSIFSAFTLPYILGPAAPEMMGPFMQRTFGDLNDPVQARTQAVVVFLFCAAFGWFYVRSIAANHRRQAR